MAYCTTANVQSEFKDITFSASTSITSTEISDFIDQADAEINGRVGLVYVTPITGSIALLIIKSISIGIVTQRVKDILAVKTGNPDVEQEGRTNSAIAARKMLDEIVSGKMLLTDAVKRSSGDGVKSYTSINNIEHVFEKETNQW